MQPQEIIIKVHSGSTTSPAVARQPSNQPTNAGCRCCCLVNLKSLDYTSGLHFQNNHKTSLSLLSGAARLQRRQVHRASQKREIMVKNRFSITIFTLGSAGCLGTVNYTAAGPQIRRKSNLRPNRINIGAHWRSAMCAGFGKAVIFSDLPEHH